MSAPAATKGSDCPKSRDDTTRFRCAAAHHDDQFAESAIRAYLMERPGVRGPGLREAVARRGEVLPFAGSGLPLGSWPRAGVTGALVAGVRFGLWRRGRPGSPRGPLVLGVVAGWIGLFFVLCRRVGGIFRLRSCDGRKPGSGGGGLVIAPVCTPRNDRRIRRLGRSSCAGVLALYPTDDGSNIAISEESP